MFLSIKIYTLHTSPDLSVLSVIRHAPAPMQCYSVGGHGSLSSQRLFPLAACLHYCYNSSLSLSVWLAVFIYRLHVWLPSNLFLYNSSHHSRYDHNLFDNMDIDNFLNKCAFIEQLLCSVLSCSVVSNSANPWTVAHQATLSIGISRQEYWSGLPCPSPGLCSSC